MNKKLSLSLLVALTSSIPVVSLAETSPKPHSFGGHIASGDIEFNGSSADGDGVVQIYGFYNYGFSERLSVELGLNLGVDHDGLDCYEDDNDDWHCSTNNNESLFDLGVDEIEYTNIVAAIKGTAPISKRNSLYAKIGAQVYDYELSRNSRVLFDDNGVGLYLAVGWQYEWDMGIGMNVGFEKYDMGDLDSNTVNVGISYSF